MPRLGYACAIIFLKLTVCNSFTIDIFDSSKLLKNGKPSLTVGDIADFQNDRNRGILRIDGLRYGEILHSSIFEDFVISMLDLLSGFPERKLRKYCRVVSRELDRLEYKYTKKLSKHIWDISKMDGDEIREKMRHYLQEMLTKTPQLKAFIDEMNQVFTMEEGVKFRDYVIYVRDFGNVMKKDVVEETRALLNTIIRAVKKLSIRDQNELERKMRRAVRKHDKLYT